MSDLSRTESFSDATSVVIDSPSGISRSSVGMTESQVHTHPDGLPMSSVEKWMATEKLFGITGAGLLSSSLVAIVLLLISFFIYRRNHVDNFYFQGKHYVMVSLGEVGEIKQSGKKIYAPVYEESQ